MSKMSSQGSKSDSKAFDFVVPDGLDFPKTEEAILKFWTDIDAFQKSIQQSLDDKLPEYTFYDGPPFATGLPHYGHILAGTIKDIVTRYQHLNGFHVSRRFGWDTHGLPVEYEIDKKLGITSSEDVMEMGIAKYNAECRGIVTRYCAEWEQIVGRMGRWIDFRNDYKTLEPWYMESVWWVFKTIFEKDLVYKGFRVMPYSTGCTTPLSNFEATSNYKDVSDPAVVVSFPTIDDPDVSFVAWTTTPWTLPSNLGLCVHPELPYVHIKDLNNGKQFILGESRLPELYPKMKKQKNKYKGGEFEIVKRYTGKELKGKKYTPLFPYFKDHPNAFQVLVDEYVTDDSGTGVVHQAPAFGEDDYRVCMAHGVTVPGGDLPCPVDADGKFTSEVTDFVGRYVKEADGDICTHLKGLGRLVSKNSISHSYPFCWRSDTPLIYKAVPSWFVRIDTIKENLLENNTKTYWVPASVKEKRFHNWLENARDWNISRNRYWGTPLPIWMSEDEEEIVVVGSIEELERLTGTKVTDLHRESIDDLEIPSKQGKGMLKRIPEVFDCWFESGSMPYAQVHYPFENKERFEKGFPADFIAEGLDQTRGWFYTLMVLSTALFGKPAFKNLIVNGLVLAEDGKKMSKRLKNYPDPMQVVNAYGADALRLYLINSPVVRAEPLRFAEAGVLQNLKEIFIPWFHGYRFFVQNAQRVERDQGWVFDRAGALTLGKSSANIMDKWILASLNNLVKFVRQEMDKYRLYTVIPRLVRFIEDLTNWYLRLNRLRLKGFGDEGLEDTKQGLSVMYVVLLNLSKLMAPFTPFFSEYSYRKLTCPDPEDERAASVHFQRVPEAEESMIDVEIERSMTHMQEVITAGRLARGNEHPLKRPLRELTVVHENQAYLDGVKVLESYIKSELNVRKITYSTEEHKYCQLSAKADGKVLGKKLGKAFAAVNKAVQALSHAELSAFQESGTVTVAGHELTLSDVFLNRAVLVDEKKFSAQVTPSKMTVVLDTYVDKVLIGEQTARQLVSRVQKLRKTSGVSIGEVFNVFYHVEGSAEAVKDVKDAVADNAEIIMSTLRSIPYDRDTRCPPYAQIVGSSTDELGDSKLTVLLALPCPILVGEQELEKSLGLEAKIAKGVISCVSSMDYDWLCKNAGKSVELTIDGKVVKLARGKEYFLSLEEMK